MDEFLTVRLNMDEFLQKRPSLNDLAMRNIIHTEYIEYDYNDARNIQLQKQQNIKTVLNNKLDEMRRPTITDLGDMHIIPHDYLDRLLEEAVANHRRGTLYYNRFRAKQLPSPVAATLAETLLFPYTDSDDDDIEIKQIEFDLNQLKLLHNHIKYAVYGYVRNFQNFLFEEYDNNPYYTISELIVQIILFYYHHIDEDEWMINFIYEPMNGFLPINSERRDQIINNLDRKLCLRPSTEQIEKRGVVPPNYFQEPEQSFMRQALRREIALDTLEGFLLNREDILNLVNRGILKPDFIYCDYGEAVQIQYQRKQLVMNELNNKLDPNKRPSVIHLFDKGLLNDDEDVKDNDNGYIYNLTKQIEELQEELDANDNKMRILNANNSDLESEICLLKEIENKHLVKISVLEGQALKINLNDQKKELNRLREEQNANELYKLDSKALEIELSKQRLKTQILRDDEKKLKDELYDRKYKIYEMEQILQRFVKEKIELIQNTNQQINQLRDYLCYYHKYFVKQQNEEQEKYG